MTRSRASAAIAVVALILLVVGWAHAPGGTCSPHDRVVISLLVGATLLGIAAAAVGSEPDVDNVTLGQLLGLTTIFAALYALLFLTGGSCGK